MEKIKKISKTAAIKDALREYAGKYSAKEIAEKYGVSRQHVAMLSCVTGYPTKSKRRDRRLEIKSLMPFYDEIVKDLIIAKPQGLKKQKVLEKYGLDFGTFYRMKKIIKKLKKN